MFVKKKNEQKIKFTEPFADLGWGFVSMARSPSQTNLPQSTGHQRAPGLPSAHFTPMGCKKWQILQKVVNLGCSKPPLPTQTEVTRFRGNRAGEPRDLLSLKGGGDIPTHV
jgi:hypothetical protein